MAGRAPRLARVHVVTLGCPKNEADSAHIGRLLAARGVELTADPSSAGHILINTCGFVRDAKEESIAAILEAVGDYRGKSILVMGCLVERYRAELEQGIPEVEAWYGLADVERLVDDLAPGGRGTSGGAGGFPPARATPPAGRPRARAPQQPGSGPGPAASFAYVKISDGCDEGCTFCAIPGIKGPISWSRAGGGPGAGGSRACGGSPRARARGPGHGRVAGGRTRPG